MKVLTIVLICWWLFIIRPNNKKNKDELKKNQRN